MKMMTGNRDIVKFDINNNIERHELEVRRWRRLNIQRTVLLGKKQKQTLLSLLNINNTAKRIMKSKKI